MKNAHGAAKRLRRLLRRSLNIPLVVIQLAQCTRLCQDQAALRPSSLITLVRLSGSATPNANGSTELRRFEIVEAKLFPAPWE